MWLAVEPADAIAIKLGRHTINQGRIDAKAMGTADTAAMRATVIGAAKAHGKFSRCVSIRAAVSRVTWRSETNQFRFWGRQRRSLIEQERPATITLRAHAGAPFGARAQCDARAPHGAGGPRADRPPPDQTFGGRCR